MTNRRSFLGLLAAAPFVAPVAVKDMGEIAPSASSVAYRSMLVNGETITIRYWFRAGAGVKRSVRQICQGFGKAVSPNRLHGTYINSDGEAV